MLQIFSKASSKGAFGGGFSDPAEHGQGFGLASSLIGAAFSPDEWHVRSCCQANAYSPPRTPTQPTQPAQPSQLAPRLVELIDELDDMQSTKDSALGTARDVTELLHSSSLRSSSLRSSHVAGRAERGVSVVRRSVDRGEHEQEDHNHQRNLPHVLGDHVPERLVTLSKHGPMVGAVPCLVEYPRA